MFFLKEMFVNSYKRNEMKYVMLLICVNKLTHCPCMVEGFLNDCTHTDEKLLNLQLYGEINSQQSGLFMWKGV